MREVIGSGLALTSDDVDLATLADTWTLPDPREKDVPALLVARGYVGCSRSATHAVSNLFGLGVRAIVAARFGENTLAALARGGIVPVVVPSPIACRIADAVDLDAALLIRVDLVNLALEVPAMQLRGFFSLDGESFSSLRSSQ